ncbi:MAG: wax ester/triacylglycerol synthase family O-acyltransferase [Candidatus Binatia bacterium]|nr:wax ester/triacylglycerol synthase family O-acyltransferase [Candidatus Binatia bacterium]
MSSYNYDRLSAQDYSFLTFEKGGVHMHVASVQIFEAGPMRTESGGVNIRAIRKATESVLHLIPRYRQRLAWTPVEGRPVWVDDAEFNLGYHIRHTSLPRPGDTEQLKHLAARIMSQPLDRTRPLWESWVVEGLEGGDRFAIVSKMHHCMMDGSSGVDLAHILLSPVPQTDTPKPVAYIPRPVPTGYELLRDSVGRALSAPIEAVHGLQEFANASADLRDELRVRIDALRELAGWVVKGASDTPMNGKLGPHRRFDWLTMPLDDVKALSKRLHCTVNDVILATVSGAVRTFLIHRRVDPERIDFRVSAPVSVRREEDRGKMGNHVSSWIVRLPIDLSDPLDRLRGIHAITQDLKASNQALGVEMMMAMAEWTPSVVLSLGARAASGPINMIVTNVPGPQIPLYLLGARLLEAFPLVPLLENTGLGIALFSYDGRLCWGFNGEYERLADMRRFVEAVQAAFEELRAAAPAPKEPAAVVEEPQSRVAAAK